MLLRFAGVLLWARFQGLAASLCDEVGLVQVSADVVVAHDLDEASRRFLAEARDADVDGVARPLGIDGAARPPRGTQVSSSGDSDYEKTLVGGFASLLEVGSQVTHQVGSQVDQEQALAVAKEGEDDENQTLVGELGFHEKLVEGLPKLQQNCKIQRAASDCERAELILSLLINSTAGPEPKPPYTHNSLANGMAGLSFFLYFPGPMYAFATLDTNHDNVVQMSEIWKNIPIETGDGTLLVENGFFEVLDGNFKDGNVTRTDMYEYMRSLILVRDVVRDMDLVNPYAPTPKCLISARRVLEGAKLPRPKLGYWTKLICIFFIFTGALASHFFFCAPPPKEDMEYY